MLLDRLTRTEQNARRLAEIVGVLAKYGLADWLGGIRHTEWFRRHLTPTGFQKLANVSHEARVFWASHVVHHSSEHYNLSTALRQTWVPMTYLPFWLPLPLLGFPPWMVLLAQSWRLIYQFGLHTERIGRLPRPIEFVFNTPSHHRVHHGSNEVYLDRNYGGILIIWDRMFGTFEPERDDDRPRYGARSGRRCPAARAWRGPAPRADRTAPAPARTPPALRHAPPAGRRQARPARPPRESAAPGS